MRRAVRSETRVGRFGTVATATALLVCAMLLAPRAEAQVRPRAGHDAGARSGVGCRHWGRPALATLSGNADSGALRVFAIQFAQDPAAMATAGDYRNAIDCAIEVEVLPHLARNHPNLVVFDEDVGLETIAVGARAAAARALLSRGDPSCLGVAPPCETFATLADLDQGYGRALAYLTPRFPELTSELGESFVAATDTFVRVFMTTMAQAARRYGVYIVASNTQARFRISHDPTAIRALRGSGTSVYAPTSGVAYDQTFVWSPRLLHPRLPVPEANLLATNVKVPLTSFEQDLGFAAGPTHGAAAVRNLKPIAIAGTGARLGIATSLPAFEYGAATSHPCADVAQTYMRCLNSLGANVVIQADANDGGWTGAAAGGESWQPLDWMGSTYRAVSDPSVRFDYAVNPFMVGNLADIPFDGQSAILERGRVGNRCAYVGNDSFVPGADLPSERAWAGGKSQFLALAPWVASGRSRSTLAAIGDRLDAGHGSYVQTAVVADLTFPVRRHRPGCLIAGR